MDKIYGTIGGLTVRKLTAADIDEVMKLQLCVYENLPDKSNFVLTTSDEFAETILMDFAVGAFDGATLAAVSTVVMNRETDRNIGFVCGYEPHDCVTYDTTFVRREYRGRGIQKQFIVLKDEAAVSAGAKFAFATVSPDNRYSLNNLLSSGFEIVDKKVMYGGEDRFVVKKDLLIQGKERKCQQD